MRGINAVLLMTHHHIPLQFHLNFDIVLAIRMYKNELGTALYVTRKGPNEIHQTCR